jgi:hypothetical protein
METLMAKRYLTIYPCLTDPGATEKQRIRHWERCVNQILDEPDEGWKEALQLRDENGLTKYS